MDFTLVRRKIQNRFAKFPLKVLVYRPVNDDDIEFSRMDALRPVKEDGKDVYVFKGTGELILPPRYGLEDKYNTIAVIKVGEGDYQILSGKLLGKLDDKSRELLWSIQHDEQAKYIYASNVQLINSRFDKPLSALEKALPLVVIIIALAIAGTIILAGSTGNIAGLNQAVGVLTNSINHNTDALIAAGKLGASAGHAPTG